MYTTVKPRTTFFGGLAEINYFLSLKNPIFPDEWIPPRKKQTSNFHIAVQFVVKKGSLVTQHM